MGETNERNINDEIFWNNFKYQNPLFLAKDLIRANEAKNKQLVNNINGFVNLSKTIVRKEIHENKKPNKTVNTVEKIFNFNKQQKGKRLPSDLAIQLKILTPKQMFQRLPIAFAQARAGDTSWILNLWILEIVKHLIPTDYYSIFQKK